MTFRILKTRLKKAEAMRTRSKRERYDVCAMLDKVERLKKIVDRLEQQGVDLQQAYDQNLHIEGLTRQDLASIIRAKKMVAPYRARYLECSLSPEHTKYITSSSSCQNIDNYNRVSTGSLSNANTPKMHS